MGKRICSGCRRAPATGKFTIRARTGDLVKWFCQECMVAAMRAVGSRLEMTEFRAVDDGRPRPPGAGVG